MSQVRSKSHQTQLAQTGHKQVVSKNKSIDKHPPSKQNL